MPVAPKQGASAFLNYATKIKYKTNNKQSTNMIGWISLNRFCEINANGCRINPSAIPVATLDVRGIIIIVTNAGRTTSNLFQFILLISMAIKAPTIINAGAVTSGVMTERMGEKNNVIKKQTSPKKNGKVTLVMETHLEIHGMSFSHSS